MRVQPSVTISGASSFTGAWLCRGFAREGWQVTGLCSARAASDYVGLKAQRVAFAANSARLIFNINAEDQSMAQFIAANPGQIWIHHHHWMQNFRSPEYDTSKAIDVGIKPLRQICKALKSSGYRALIFSGSYFEPGEGGNFETGKETPYAKSKKAVWQALSQEAQAHGLTISKVVIPDPVGPLENEDRVIPLAINKALKKGEFQLRHGEALADHIPVDILAKTYVTVADLAMQGHARVVRPSGWTCANREWVSAISSELIVKGLQLPPLAPTTVTTGSQAATAPAATASVTAIAPGFTNPDQEKCVIDWPLFWATYASWVKTSTVSSL